MVNHLIGTLSRTVMKIPFILLVLCLLVLPVAAVTMQMYDNMNFQGGDYGEVTEYGPIAQGMGASISCRERCVNDPQCTAVTYQKPGFTGTQNANCWLKQGSITASQLVPQHDTVIWLKIPDLPAPPAPPQTGAISITSSPSGAQVYVDLIYGWGKTPTTATDIAPGSHTVSLSLTGYNDISMPVTVTAGQTSNVNVALQLAAPTTGSLFISSTPSGAAVIVDGVSRGVTPTTVQGLAAGSHPVRVTMPGYGDYEGTTPVTAGQTTPVTVSLSTLITTTQTTKSQTTTTQTTSSGTGSIEVRSQPSAATISLDGSQKGATPAKLTNVKSGSHEVALSLAGYPDWKQTVTVKTGETASINAVLGTSTQTTVGQPATSGTGSLSVATTPTGAQVYVDGAFIGNSPTKTSGLSAGSHFLTFKMDGYTDLGVGITITTGQTTEYSTSLVSSNAGVNKRTPGFAAVLGILSIACIVAGRRLFSR